MKIKELRAALKGLPANMEVYVNSGLSVHGDTPSPYNYALVPVRKAKKKLHKKIKGYDLVQSRPVKDEDATLSLILE